MQLILNNPYRVLGLLVGATAREQDRQIKRLRQFIEAEQDFKEGYSFPVLGELNRNIDNINLAASKLNLNNDKMNAALFWFYKGNEITDEPAFDSMLEGDYKNTLEIWKKLATAAEVTKRNSSAFQNFSTACLAQAFKSSPANVILLELGIRLKLKFLESDFVEDFKSLATDETYKITKKELQLSFLKQLQSEIINDNSMNFSDFIQIINKPVFSAKEDFLKILARQPIEKVEKIVEEIKEKRKLNSAAAAKLGIALFYETCENLELLQSILKTDKIVFSSISDKVSQEILQCGIDYFKHYKDSETDPGKASMDLFKKARSIAIGSIAIQESQENIDRLQEWIDEKPERDKLNKIQGDFEKLIELIKEYEACNRTVELASRLLSSSHPLLNNIKTILGSSDDLYVGISTRIAAIAQGMCVDEINELLDEVNADRNSTAVFSPKNMLIFRVNESMKVILAIGMMDLKEDFRNHYLANRQSLNKLMLQLNSSIASYSTKRSSSSGGCYIATMVYGNYNHPQVMVLRKFRDAVLEKYLLGKWFIKIYYRYSPKLVDKLKNKRTINKIIRKTLDLLINIIK
jgi:hypothetical protein